MQNLLYCLQLNFFQFKFGLFLRLVMRQLQYFPLVVFNYTDFVLLV